MQLLGELDVQMNLLRIIGKKTSLTYVAGQFLNFKDALCPF